MRIYTLRNDKDEYISMSGDRTTSWIEASKFTEDEIESRLERTNPEFKLVGFNVEEIKQSKEVGEVLKHYIDLNVAIRDGVPLNK